MSVVSRSPPRCRSYCELMMSADTSPTNASDESPRSWWHIIATPLICLLILGSAAGAVGMIFSTEPTAQRETATRRSAMLVETITVERGSFRPQIGALGTVEPALDVMLRPRVSGLIVEQADAFVPGGFVEEGELLLRIDPIDYENRLAQRQADLQQAEADLLVEQGRRNVAQREYELLGEELSEEERALVLREPQIRSAEARVASARTAVKQAELDLERTAIRAPCDATILERHVNVGTQASMGDVVARLVAVDEYWVLATVPQASLPFIETGSRDDDQGAPVDVRHRTAWPAGTVRTGYVARRIGTLDGTTRLARVLIRVPDPLGRNTASDGAETPPLLIGSVVSTTIAGRELTDVVRLPREYLRAGDTVWTMEDGQLRIQRLDIQFEDERYAYVRDGLANNARVVTTNLSTVSDGAPLRTTGMGGDGANQKEQSSYGGGAQ